MADDETKSRAQDFVVSVGPTVIETEEQALAIYYQMQSYPELQALLAQHQNEIARAIQQKDVQTLIGIVQKVQSDFLRDLSEKAYQVQIDTERKMAEARVDPNELASRVSSTEQALSEALGTTDALYASKKLRSRAFIEKLVKNYSRLPEAETRTFTDAIIANAEAYADLSPEEIIQSAAITLGVSPESIAKLQRDPDVVERVTDLQKNNVTTIEQQVITAVLESPEPTTAIHAMNRYVEQSETKPIEIPDLIEKAKLVSTASSIVKQVPENSIPDYGGFFTALAQTGNPIEKAFAPLADAMLTIFPSETKENIVTGVMSSLWKKETRGGGVVQGALGGLFQSDTVTKAIQQGNAVFSTTSRGAVITPFQSFFGDVITTVFHPTITDVWVEMVRTDTGLPASLYQHYLSLLARHGSQEAAKALAARLGKKAAQEAGKVAAKKITVKAVGQAVGGALGSLLMAIGVPPGIAQAIGAWLLGKIVDFAGGIVGKVVGFIKGLANYVGEPWFKDFGTVGALLLVAILIVPALLSEFGTFFPLLPGASYYEKNTSAAYIQGMGSVGGPGGPTMDCLGADKGRPECDMTPCDSSKQDCRWPTYGFIYQGPQTGGSCPGTHAGVQAIDIDPIGGAAGPVYATINGTVRAFFGCPTDSGCPTCSCANYVIITGESYSVGYWHLANIQTVQTGQTVKVGDVVGLMDNTGHSTGTHLHYQYWGPGSINSILPVSVLTCNDANASCLCPYIVTGSAQ